MYQRAHSRAREGPHDAVNRCGFGIPAARLQSLSRSSQSKIGGAFGPKTQKPDQFLRAYYETAVFGALIRADFELEFEDETDSSNHPLRGYRDFPKIGQELFS